MRKDVKRFETFIVKKIPQFFFFRNAISVSEFQIFL